MAEPVTVCIPAFNAGDMLRRAVESALAQESVSVEVIVIDDGSTDGSVEQCASSCRVLHTSRQGPAIARNQGAAYADGKWIAFLDADDWWEPSKLKRQLTTVDGAAVSCTDRVNEGARGGLPLVHSLSQPLESGDVFHGLLLDGNFITTSSVLISREAFLAHGGFATECVPAEDWDLWLRVLHGSRLAVVREPLTHYLHASTSLSTATGRMNAARLVVAERALALPRAVARGAQYRRSVLGAIHRTNAWDASRRGAWRESVGSAVRAMQVDAGRTSSMRLLRSLARR